LAVAVSVVPLAETSQSQQIDNAEQLISMNLSSSQNKLLRAEVSFTMIMTWVQIGVLVFGFFGMNLHSGLEWNESGPWSPKTHTHKGPSWNFLNVGLPLSTAFFRRLVCRRMPSAHKSVPHGRMRSLRLHWAVHRTVHRTVQPKRQTLFIMKHVMILDMHFQLSGHSPPKPTALCGAGVDHHNRWHGRRMPVDVALSPQDGHPHSINLSKVFGSLDARRIGRHFQWSLS
jgi:hypothetical protein